jgi:hypothetical protein
MTARKPLRRTAWSLFAGGFALLAVMIVAGIVASGSGTDVRPGQAVAWPNGQVIVLLRPLGPGATGGSSITCTVTAPGAKPELRWLTYGKSVPPGPVDASITCEKPAKLLAGTARVVAQTTRSPLILLPILMIIVGLALFVPRFSWTVAKLGAPFSRGSIADIWADDPIDRGRPKRKS